MKQHEKDALFRGRRRLLAWAGLSALALPGLSHAATGDLRISAMDVRVVRVTGRTRWINIILHTSGGLTGLGEASLGAREELPQLADFFALVEGESPSDVLQYRRRGWPLVSERVTATAFSAIEQALWDINAKAMGVPLYELFGGKLHHRLPVYANINRATVNREPAAFAENAAAAVAEGFSALKAAPFDGLLSPQSNAAEIRAGVDQGVAAAYAMRATVGPDVSIRIDAHSLFDVPLAIEVAGQLQGANLAWYEEPVSPERLADTKAIHEAIEQPLAGGEFLFGVEEFRDLCAEGAVDIIMPDVKHCGGLLETLRIATVADAFGVLVSPHNPSGPVATAASAALCAALPNFSILEFQWGEADWRGDLVSPAENFVDGYYVVSDAPGIGIELSEVVAAARSV